jgi:hypothetical protein
VIENRVALLTEGNVAGIHINHEDAVPFKKPKDRLDFRPARTELLFFLRTPIRHYFFGEVGRLVEIGAGEIENERPGHDGHFDDPKFIVIGEHFGNGATTDVRDLTCRQPQINVSFAPIVGLLLMHFDGRDSLFGLAFDGKYVTMNSGAKGIAKKQAVPLAVFPRSAQQLRSIAHGHTANRRCGPLRGRSYSLACEGLRLAGRATRPGVSRPEVSDGSSSLRRRDHSVDRRQRKPLGRTPPQGHPSRATENRDFALCRARWVHGGAWLNSRRTDANPFKAQASMGPRGKAWILRYCILNRDSVNVTVL